MEVATHLYTFLAFCAACFTVPYALVLYTVVNGTRTCLLGFLGQWHSRLEFIRNVTVRTATDTMRNQGIITILLTVKGRYDISLIRERIKENILNRRNKDGKLMYPHLQTPLTQRMGRYAWSKSSYFDIANHVVLASNMFRGRLVNDLNIQEYVSEIVGKYLPSELPQWQITVIPTYQLDRFYLLIRIHHLLLSEEGIQLGDLLILGPERPVIFRRLLDEDDENPQDVPPATSPLTGLFKAPVAIPKLFTTIRDAIVHYWNELVSVYDPVENPEIMKSKAGIQICSAIVLITSIAILQRLLILTRQSDISLLRKLLKINTIVFTEIERRQCTPQFVTAGIINSFKPKQLIQSSLTWLQLIGYTCAVTMPLLLVCELRAIVSRNKNKGFSRSVTEATFNYTALLISAIKELFYISSIIYTAPKTLLDELIISHRDPKHELQTVSLCSRKMVAWSDPVSLDKIRRIAHSVNASPSELLISATSGALKEYFRSFGFKLPESVLATARFIPLESLMRITRDDEISGPPSGRGLVCLALPTSQLHDDPRELIQEVQKVLNETRERQVAIYEASLWQLDGGYITKILPSLAVRLILNHLSRRYAVALTEVAPEVADESRKQFIWGQEVESVMYWRPPQSNICLSLTVMSYGDSVRLGVMADQMIAPGHNLIATNFMQQINMLAAMAGIPGERSSFSTTSSSSHNYQPNIPPDGAMSIHGSNTSVSSASEELRRLEADSPDLNMSTSPESSRSTSPESGGAQSIRSSYEENIFPFTD